MHVQNENLETMRNVMNSWFWEVAMDGFTRLLIHSYVCITSLHDFCRVVCIVGELDLLWGWDCIIICHLLFSGWYIVVKVLATFLSMLWVFLISAKLKWFLVLKENFNLWTWLLTNILNKKWGWVYTNSSFLNLFVNSWDWTFWRNIVCP